MRRSYKYQRQKIGQQEPIVVEDTDPQIGEIISEKKGDKLQDETNSTDELRSTISESINTKTTKPNAFLQLMNKKSNEKTKDSDFKSPKKKTKKEPKSDSKATTTSGSRFYDCPKCGKSIIIQ